MATILTYLKKHFSEDYKITTYLLFFLFIGILIFLNHTTNIPTLFFRQHQDSPYIYGYYFLFFGFAYYSTIIIIATTKSDFSFLKKLSFWLTSLFAILLVSIRFGFLNHYSWIQENIAPEKVEFYTKVIARSIRFIIFSIGILVFYKLIEKHNKNFYGFSIKDVKWKLYLLLLLIAFPFILFASYQPSFLRQYPSIGYTGTFINKWLALVIYEPTYLLDFISIEWFFRGFLILGMIKSLGSKAILPMVALYVFFHIGKPTGEIIGSAFGGYVLGVISMYSKSIIGGIVIHMGVAFLMDAMAIFQKIDSFF
ncbi:CPBP family intramembrane metalloprotease [Polaribacter sp. MSW13]|uniref:CPBP family intramembrane metalloprotease n=1 Tax=Polaribacter marinus TaxID=2916838 RepID=A0A9X2AJE3_9FLAO|nr:CPBP family intramembrane glutamic endopeptidase [Polaribacter marinus]MCI2228313.1 CPBP family intramembrane metalloprotease [Polaribacter marinus]